MTNQNTLSYVAKEHMTTEILASKSPFFGTLSPEHTATVNEYLKEVYKYRTLLFIRQCDEAPLIVMAVEHGETPSISCPPISPNTAYIYGKLDPHYPVPPYITENPIYQYIKQEPVPDEMLRELAAWASKQIWDPGSTEANFQKHIIADETTCCVGGGDITHPTQKNGLCYLTPTPTPAKLH